MNFKVSVRDGMGVWHIVAKFAIERNAQSFCDKVIPTQDWKITDITELEA